MNTQFTFTPQGVQDWQDEVYAGGQSSIDSECTQINDHFVTWMVYRFSLNASQEQFLINLGTLTQLSYSASIQDTLQHQGQITLDKEDPAMVSRTIKHPKIVYKEQQNRTNNPPSRAKTADHGSMPQKVSLKFTITYPDEV